MLSPFGLIQISDFAIGNLFMHSLKGMILLYLTTPFCTTGVLHELYYSDSFNKPCIYQPYFAEAHDMTVIATCKSAIILPDAYTYHV